ncbi:MAG: DUF177 domain-containing protein [Cycloclasticus sp.]|nr:DUF177 domain-containing protein [Cycloclasticus sp.]
MSKTLQKEVDPILCASQERKISGELSYNELTRLKDVIEPSSQPIRADLEFSRIGKFVVVTGRISASLVLQCVACLEALDFQVEIDVKLAIINSESLLNQLPDNYEPCLLEGDHLLISELVESEVVLVLPDVPRHNVCPIDLPKSSSSKDFALQMEEKKNPFDVLESLKKH